MQSAKEPGILSFKISTCFCKLSNVSISYCNSRCSTQTAFVGTLGFKFTYQKNVACSNTFLLYMICSSVHKVQDKPLDLVVSDQPF